MELVSNLKREISGRKNATQKLPAYLPGDEENESLRCHIVEGQCSDALHFVFLELSVLLDLHEQREEVMPIDLIMLAKLVSLPNYTHEELVDEWRSDFHPQLLGETGENVDEEEVESDAEVANVEKLAHLQHLRLLVLQSITLETEAARTDNVGGEARANVLDVDTIGVR